MRGISRTTPIKVSEMIKKGSGRIVLANGTYFDSNQDETILNAAMSSDIALEYSCRTGRCSVCKAKVVSGDTKLVSTETSLTTDDIAAGYILTCCRSATSDLELDIEDLGDLVKYKPKTVPARIDTINPVSHDVVSVVLRTPPTGTLKFRAGQYIDLIGPNGVRRSYSLANAPRKDGKLKLEIRKVEGGQLSRYWFGEAKVNDLLRLEGPLGTFCLRAKPSKNLILLATGTGIAPIKAILEELAASSSGGAICYENIYLYWGGRVQADIYWLPEFAGLPLTFIPVLSRAAEWSGRTGYVQDAVIADQIELGLSSVYACGSESMIHSARETLVKSGLSSKQFYSDAFVSSS